MSEGEGADRQRGTVKGRAGARGGRGGKRGRIEEGGAYRKRETQSRVRSFFFLMERTKSGPRELQNG